MVTLLIRTGSTGRSPSFGCTPEMVRTLFIPSITFPKIVYLLSKPGSRFRVMKNCELAESGDIERAAPTGRRALSEVRGKVVRAAVPA